MARLVAFKDSGRHVGDYGKGRRLHRDAVLDIECEIWVPAARPDVLREAMSYRRFSVF